jgi:ATP-dependent DNA helicase RecG
VKSIITEKNGYVEVEMEAEYLRPGIFVITRGDPERYGIPELLVLNSVYEVGVVSVETLLPMISKVSDKPWAAIHAATEKPSRPTALWQQSRRVRIS